MNEIARDTLEREARSLQRQIAKINDEIDALNEEIVTLVVKGSPLQRHLRRLKEALGE